MKLSDIERIGVVGGGTMGFGIGINFALWDYQVTICDLNEDALERCRQRIQKALKIFMDEELITPNKAKNALKHFNMTTKLTDVAQANFITETIIERLADKQQLFHTLDEMCPPYTILASNTSALPINDIVKGVKRQDKIILTHYFEPPHIVPGVDIAKGPGTSDETFDLTYELLKKCRKVPVKTLKAIPGAMVGTIQRAMGRAARLCWAEGIADAENIDLGIRACFGFRSFYESPMRHGDLSGQWKWSKDIRIARAALAVDIPGLSEEGKEKIKQHALQNNTWFIKPEEFEEAVEARDREYARRLKDWYWGKVD